MERSAVYGKAFWLADKGSVDATIDCFKTLRDLNRYPKTTPAGLESLASFDTNKKFEFVVLHSLRRGATDETFQLVKQYCGSELDRLSHMHLSLIRVELEGSKKILKYLEKKIVDQVPQEPAVEPDKDFFDAFEFVKDTESALVDGDLELARKLIAKLPDENSTFARMTY